MYVHNSYIATTLIIFQKNWSLHFLDPILNSVSLVAGCVTGCRAVSLGTFYYFNDGEHVGVSGKQNG